MRLFAAVTVASIVGVFVGVVAIIAYSTWAVVDAIENPD